MRRVHTIAVLGLSITAILTALIALWFSLHPKPEPVQKPGKATPGSSAKPWKQTFENSVRDLLFVSLDDKEHGFITRHIDMAHRASLFDRQGWMEYQAYAAEQKIILRKRAALLWPTPQSIGMLIEDSRDYDRQLRGDTIFNSEGHFCYGAQTNAYACDEARFKLRVWLSGDVQKPDFKILGWSVQW